MQELTEKETGGALELSSGGQSSSGPKISDNIDIRVGKSHNPREGVKQEQSQGHYPNEDQFGKNPVLKSCNSVVPSSLEAVPSPETSGIPSNQFLLAAKTGEKSLDKNSPKDRGSMLTLVIHAYFVQNLAAP